MDLFDWLDEDKDSEEETSEIKREDVTIAGELFKEERPLSVSELSNLVKTMVEGIGKVVVQGEITNLSTPASGHIYFKIKDTFNTVNAVIWKGSAKRLKFKPEEGMEVTIAGKMTVFSARSEYQINVTSLEPSGIGSLMKLFNERKEKLEKEGLFNAEHKKPINKNPKTIAVITSKTGDVFYDILHRIEERFPCRVLLYSVRVQGEGAEKEIVQALKDLNSISKQESIDTIILARGGGSVEDLWAFNDENIVREIFASSTPVITAIGHEPDVTLVDYVADLRAPTPTGAAELATESQETLKYRVEQSSNRLTTSLSDYILRLEQNFDYLKLRLYDSTKIVNQLEMKFDYLKQRLTDSFSSYFSTTEKALNQKETLLKSLSVDSVLQRGFSFVQSETGEFVKSSKTKAKDVVITFKDGNRKAELKK
ncbi:MAG: exodeoxyribonuclease VII large subunit [Proteobacteria bacterium]|nr:exodeoxyribonuclease VII large subunit [Pseudomonadota bacterium]